MVKQQQSPDSSQRSTGKRLIILGFIVFATCWLPSVAFPQQPQTQTDPIYAVNAKYVQGVGPGYWPTAGSNLTLNLTSGTAVCGNTVQIYAGGTLTLAATATNYIYLNTAQSCIPAYNTTGFNSNTIPIAEVLTNANSIISITDVRTMFVSTGASGTLTSVAMTGDGVIYNTAVPGSPITTSGTFAPQLLSQTANTLLAGPGSGVAATPTFRTLVSADLPVTIGSNTTGNAATATALAAVPSQCAGFAFALGIATNGNANCLGSQTANSFYAAPSGSTGVPTFRAIVGADLPTIGISGGGTGQTTAAAAFNALSPLTTEGDLLYYHSSTNARLARGTNGQCLTSNGTDPVWGSCSTGSGTVTSVGLAMPSIFSVSGSPVINSGTLTASWTSQTQNLVLASPSGSSGNPSFRSLVGADLPAPTSSTLGGVKSLTCSASQFVNQISTAGAPVCATPSGGGADLGNGVTVIDATTMVGADLAAKINAAVALLPSSGGVVDARGLIGNQTGSTTIVGSRKVRVLFGCGLSATFTVTPIFEYGDFEGCGGHQTNPETVFTLSGTTGGSAVVNANVNGIAIVGVSTSDGSIGFDGSSGWSSGYIYNSSASGFQYDYKIGGGGSESSYNHLEDDEAYGAATYGFWNVGNASSNEFEHLTCTGAATCYEFDASVATAMHLDAEQVTVNAVAFAGLGNQVFGLYAENSSGFPIVAHFESGARSNVIDGGTSRGMIGSTYDGGVDQISNYTINLDFGVDANFPTYWGMTYPLFSFPALAEPYMTELDPGISWGGVWQALQYSSKGLHGPAQGYIGYAPIGLGGLEQRGGINMWGSLVAGALPGYINPPSLSCDSSGTGTTYTAYAVITDWNGNKTTPSQAATIQCPNVPSVSHPITVTPTTNWYGNVVAGVKGYDYLWGDTAHSFALATQGPQQYTGGSLTAYTPNTVNKTGTVTTANNTLDDGAGNVTIAGNVTLSGTSPSLNVPAVGLTVSGTAPTYGAVLNLQNLANDQTTINVVSAFAPNLSTGKNVCFEIGFGPGAYNNGNWCFTYAGSGSASNSMSMILPGASGPAWQVNGNGNGTLAGALTLGTALAIAQGGTGQTTATAAFNALSPMTTLGDIIYGGASGAGTRLAGNASITKSFLTSTGSSGVATAPAWSTIATSDLPSHLATLLTLWCYSALSTTSGTYYFGGFGGMQTACSSLTTALTGGMPVGVGGTIKNLRCAAGAAGHAAGSGVIKIYDGGTAKSPTCTIGTGTTCSDTSNSFTYTAGDLIQLSVASAGAGETLANVSCSAEVWVSAD